MKRRKIRSKVQFTSNRPNATSAHTDRLEVLTGHEIKIVSKYSRPKNVFNTNFVEISCPWPFSHRALSSSQWVDQFVVFWDLGSVLTHRSLNWNEVENPMCLKLAVTAPLIYHRGWEARGKPGKRRLSTSTKATSVTLSYCLGEWLSPRRAPSRKYDLQKWLWVANEKDFPNLELKTEGITIDAHVSYHIVCPSRSLILKRLILTSSYGDQ